MINFLYPPKSDKAPKTGDKADTIIAVTAIAQDHHWVPITSSEAIPVVKYAP